MQVQQQLWSRQAELQQSGQRCSFPCESLLSFASLSHSWMQAMFLQLLHPGLFTRGEKWKNSCNILGRSCFTVALKLKYLCEMAEPLCCCSGSSQMEFSQGLADVSSWNHQPSGCGTGGAWWGFLGVLWAAQGSKQQVSHQEIVCLHHSSSWPMSPSADKVWAEKSQLCSAKGVSGTCSAPWLFQVPARLQQRAACEFCMHWNYLSNFSDFT